MNRKQFIEAQGATSKNPQWSWSFINQSEKKIIFGAWDRNTIGNTSLIFSDDWEFSDRGRKQPGYKESREHIRLIEDQGYQLLTFTMIFSDKNQDDNGVGRWTIKKIIPELKPKTLQRVGKNWYASDGEIAIQLPEEIDTPEKYTEGTSKKISVNTYERNTEARTKCIAHYGYKCAVCSFDFEKAYGSIGEKFIHVHHLIPIAEVKKEYVIDPIMDLRPICPNCHAVIHKTQPILTIDQLKQHLTDRALT